MSTITIGANSSAVTGRAGRPAYNFAALLRVAILNLGAAAIHCAVVPQHLQEYLPFGIFFLLAAAAQLLLTIVAPIRPGRRLFAIGAGGTAGMLLLWLVSRTAGLPLGPTPWR